MPRLKVGVLISGRGSNLQALIDAATDTAYPAEIVAVISNRADAAGLTHAAAAGIPRHVVAHPDRGTIATNADRILHEAKVELVALAGYMRILETSFVGSWTDRL